jgi:hypothetical protein
MALWSTTLLAVAHNEHNEYPLTVLMQGKVHNAKSDLPSNAADTPPF